MWCVSLRCLCVVCVRCLCCVLAYVEFALCGVVCVRCMCCGYLVLLGFNASATYVLCVG